MNEPLRVIPAANRLELKLGLHVVHQARAEPRVRRSEVVRVSGGPGVEPERPWGEAVGLQKQEMPPDEADAREAAAGGLARLGILLGRDRAKDQLGRVIDRDLAPGRAPCDRTLLDKTEALALQLGTPTLDDGASGRKADRRSPRFRLIRAAGMGSPRLAGARHAAGPA